MRKLKNEDVAAMLDKADDLLQELQSASESIGAMKCETITDPIRAARRFSALARNAADAAGQMLLLHDLQSKQAEIDRMSAKVEKYDGRIAPERKNER